MNIGRLTTSSMRQVASASTTSVRATTRNPSSGFALLEEANHKTLPGGPTPIAVTGTEAPPDSDDVQSPETYLGYTRVSNFASPEELNHDDPRFYRTPARLELNQWAFAGKWIGGGQIATSVTPNASISFRFHARDLHLVLGPIADGKPADGKPVRFRITLDGKAPGADHGVDTDAAGYGVVTENRLYQLVRQHGNVRDRTLRVEFLVPGVQAYSFTFG